MRYEYPARIRFSEVDEQGDLTIYGLINYLQDCATFHAQEAGFGVDWNLANRKAWVVASLQLAIDRLPHFAEHIVTATWASAFRGMVGRRQFLVTAADGSRIAAGSSEWVFMDMAKNRPERVGPEQVERYGVHPEMALEEDLGDRKIARPDGLTLCETFPVEEHHLDINHHVNNGQFVNMALKYLPQDRPVRRLRVEYKKQAHLGDVLAAKTRSDGDLFFIALDDEAGEPYFLCEVRS